jgi:hypothetical protein
MTLHIYDTLEQGSDEWHTARRGIITASVVGQFITAKTVKVAANDYSRAMTAQLVAERITGYTEPTFASADMERGNWDEPLARDLYSEHYAPAVEVGFMVRQYDEWKLGYSPDGLVGDDGLIEIKSRRQKKQLATILADEVPLENMAQIQCGLLVSNRAWCDYVSHCGGMPLYVRRVRPDRIWLDAILAALAAFETSAADMIARYHYATGGRPVAPRVEQDQEMSF